MTGSVATGSSQEKQKTGASVLIESQPMLQSPQLRRPIIRPRKGGLRVTAGRNAAMNFLTPGPLQIDPEWMTGALRRAGAIRGARVVGMTRDPVGNGLVGDSYRFGLTYD